MNTITDMLTEMEDTNRDLLNAYPEFYTSLAEKTDRIDGIAVQVISKRTAFVNTYTHTVVFLDCFLKFKNNRTEKNTTEQP